MFLPEDEATAAVSYETMAELVFGKPRARNGGAVRRLILVAVLAVCSIGCATAPRPAAELETVGQLAPSYRSIAVAPVHAATELAVGYQAVSADDDVAAAPAPEAVEAPDVTPKAGLVMGAVR